MKKFKFPLMIALICLNFMAFQTSAMSTEPTAATPTETSTQTVTTNTVMNRVAEIQAMDKSNLSFKEKKALRKELRSIKKQAQVSSSGVYISAGTLILIIILLVILL